METTLKNFKVIRTGIVTRRQVMTTEVLASSQEEALTIAKLSLSKDREHPYWKGGENECRSNNTCDIGTLISVQESITAEEVK